MQYLSLDVECVATGKGHNDRFPCWVALVDDKQKVLLDAIIKPSTTYVSPLTSITGLTMEHISKRGETFKTVRNRLLGFLGPKVILVGQKPQKDIAWMELKRGVHFAAYVDLSEKFRVWNPRYSNYMYFSLAKAAYGLLGKRMHGSDAHSPVTDAEVSMELFEKFVKNKSKTAAAKTKLKLMTFRRMFPQSLMASARPKSIDGVCMNAFNAKECFCGQPLQC